MWPRLLNYLRAFVSPAAADTLANEERYRLIASVMSDYVFSLEYAPSGEIKEQWISGAFSTITGYTREEFFAKGGWVSIVHPDDHEQDARDMAQLRANQKVVTEVRIIHREGHIRWVRAYAHPQWDSQRQQLIGLYGAVQDITESKQIEASLRQREAILQVVADAANLFLQTADWRLNIDLMLERLGKTIKATHAYVFEHYTNPQGERVSTMKYEWTAPGYASELGQPDFQDISLDDEEFIQYFQTLKSGEPYIGHPLSFLPVEKEYFHSLGIKAIVEVPLFVSGRWWGTIGFDDVEHEREWSNAEVDALKIAAGILSGAIEREQADQTLRQSESLYRRAIETAGAVPYFRDRITPSYQFMGEGIRQITGYGPEEMTPALFESLVQEAVMLGDSKGLSVIEAGELAIEGKISVWKCDMRLVMPDGQSRWVNDSSVELIGSQGVSYGSIGILQDVTERKQVEASLRQREAILGIVAAAANTFLKIPRWSTEFWRSEVDQLLERLGTTLNASHAYIFENHPLTDGTPGLSMRYEWTAPGFVSELGNPKYLNMRFIVDAFETWNKQVPHGEPYIGDARHLSSTEMENLQLRGIYALLDVPLFIDGLWWGTIGFDEMSRPREWSIAEVDALITAANLLGATIKRWQMDSLLQNELQQRQTLIGELEAKNAELERFTYTVSHDLRSPLVTIKGFLGYLERDATDGNMAAFHKDMQRISLAADRMDNLLKDLLELSRIGRIGHKPQELSFADVVREARELVHGRLQQRDIRVQVQPELPVVYGDKPRLTEVVQNLLDNAAKYMGEQKEPLIEMGTAGSDGDNKVIFFVRDNGLGIDPQYQERIFGLFDKLDANSEGTGVGLALVKRIVEFHRGRIWVESQGLEHGSTFYFTLPVVVGDG